MKNILLILFLICSLLLKSQNKPHIECGSQYSKLSNKYVATKFIGTDGKYYYFLRNEEKASVITSTESFLEKYNMQMELIYSQNISLKDINDHYSIDTNKIFLLENKPVYIDYTLDKENNLIKVYAYYFDEEGNFLNNHKLIDERVYEGYSFKIKFAQSEDKSKILFYYAPLNTSYYERYEWGFKVFDSSLELLWEETHELPYDGLLFNRSSYKIGNNGNVFMMHSVVEDKKGLIYYKKYNLLVQKYKEKQFKLYNINPNDKTISSYYYKIDENKIKVVGFYSDNRVTSTSNGIFTLEIDFNKDIATDISTKEFDAKFLKENDEKSKGATNLFFNQIFRKNDNSFFAIAEKKYFEFYSDSKMNKKSYKDIYIVNFLGNGEVKWIRRLPKKSYENLNFRVKGRFLSYLVNFNKSENELNIFYNDDPDNIDIIEKGKSDVKFVHPEKSVPVLININEVGDIKRGLLYEDNDKDKFVLEPLTHLRIKENEFILYGHRDKEFRFCKIIF
jgi:hypothetical protein